MSKEANENKLYVYFDRYPDGLDKTYRQLEEELGIDHETIRRIVKESEKISSCVKGIGTSQYTHFILKKYETQYNLFNMPKNDTMSKSIETKEIKFTTRQHKICNYGLGIGAYEHLGNKKGEPKLIDKIAMLFDLKELFFSEKKLDELENEYNNKNYVMSEKVYFINKYKDRRHSLSQYSALTNELRFISDHPEIRQVMWGSKGGTKGGVWVLLKGEEMDDLDRILHKALKGLKRFQRRKRGLKPQGNMRFVFKSEKDVLDILRQFDL